MDLYGWKLKLNYRWNSWNIYTQIILAQLCMILKWYLYVLSVYNSGKIKNLLHSPMTGNYPAASARSHVLMFPSYKKWHLPYTPLSGVSSPVENRSCWVVVPGVWCQTASASPFLTAHGLVFRTLGIIAGDRVALRLLRSAIETGFQQMKHFAQNWLLSCRQCTETCSHVSSIQKY